MESRASLQHFSSALGQIEQGTAKSIASGEIRVDIGSCQERIAVRCLTCLHQLWVKSKAGAGLLMLKFRKGDSGALMGYLISAGVPKSKQQKQIVCLHCVHKLLGVVTESTNGLSITLGNRKDGGQDTTVLRRETRRSPWSQTLELTDDLLSFLCQENASTMPGQRPVATAASQIGKSGMAKGVRPRARGAAEETSTEVSQLENTFFLTIITTKCVLQSRFAQLV
jgi:hypothetical protein